MALDRNPADTSGAVNVRFSTSHVDEAAIEEAYRQIVPDQFGTRMASPTRLDAPRPRPMPNIRLSSHAILLDEMTGAERAKLQRALRGDISDPDEVRRRP